ncbi:MAG: type transport system ATP-binding protein [Thermoanaerobaculia bacterium]|jgi:ABC-2 type transport system ATP-binding protein|nr:type transport system ATP-binding protein [Thermoanaerobaculia bacterium]
MHERRVARSVIALAIVVLAVVSVPRVRLEYAPDVTFPELNVTLQLPPTANTGASETTRQWVVPIESALRGIGDTTGTRGNVNAGSATILARFKRGTDVELKAARLASDLAPLRARLPEHASLSIWPARGGARPEGVFAITGSDAGGVAEHLAEELRSAPGVREVRTFGTSAQEIDVLMTSGAIVTSGEILQGLMPRPLGDALVGSRRMPLVSAPAATNIRDVPVRTPDVMRLDSIATITQRREEPASIASLNGKPAAILMIYRDDAAQLLTFDRTVQRVIGKRGTTLWSDAAELRIILIRLLIAAVIASIVLAFGGGVPFALYIPTAIALAINVWSVMSLRADVQTLLVGAIAIAAVAPLAAARRISRSIWPLWIAAFFVLLLPIAAIFSSGALAPLLSPPAYAFALAASCALAAALLIAPRTLVAPTLDVEKRSSPQRRTLKRLLRNSAGVVLACLTVAVFFLAWFGDRLDPRRSSGSADRSSVYVHVQLPASTTLAQTTRAAQSVESALRGLPGVKRFRTFAGPGSATVVIEVEPRYQQTQRFELFQLALRSRIPTSWGTVTIQTSSEGGPSSALAESIEEQPYADDEGHVYRFLLKSTDADVLRRTAEALTTKVARSDVSRRSITTMWPEASTQIELVPAKVTPEIADAVAAELSRQSFPASQASLPNGTLLRVTTRDAPVKLDDVPLRAALFARPLQIGSETVVVENAFDIRPSSTEGGVTRELGRFVLPMEIGVSAQTAEQLLAKRIEIDRTVSLFPLPAGVIAERPQLAAWSFSMAKFRLAAVAAFLPLLLFTAAAIALGSLGRALVALAPATVSIAVVAPVLAAVQARLDEIALLATGAAVCCVTALAVGALLRISGPAGGAYRLVRTNARSAVVATIAAGALLIIAASARPAIGDAWRAPLLAAAAVLITGIPGALILPSAFDLLLRDLARRRSVGAQEIAHPLVWTHVWTDVGSLPQLSVRNVTKVYASGFRALHRVSFDLTPGVVGLLGPNGAGKTTLLRILTGLLQPTRGTISYRGVPVRAENIAEFRRSIGFLPQEFNAYAGLTAAQFLDFWALERGMDSPSERRSQIEELLVAVGLEEHADRRVRDFSGGMRQRIGIARALLGNPPLLVVDEPTTGLDIEARRRFRDLLTALARKRIVILSSHIASDVETTAQHLLLLARGELRWEGSVEDLLARARGRVFELVVSDAEVRTLAHQYRITTRVRVPNGIRVRGVAAKGESLPGASVKATLEEAYLSEISTGAIRRGSFAFVFET